MKIKPTQNNVLIEIIKEDEIKDGIYGIVKDIGPQTTPKLEIFNGKIEEKVFLRKFAGTQIKLDGKVYVIVSPNEIIATIE